MTSKDANPAKDEAAHAPCSAEATQGKPLPTPHSPLPTPLRLGVLLSGGGRTLMNILDHIRAARLAASVEVVIASRPCKGVPISRDAGLPVHLVPYRDMPDLGT